MIDTQSSSDNVIIPAVIEPLTTLIALQDGQEVIIAMSGESGTNATAQAALETFGAWSDLNWDEAARQLSQIRHDSEPTAPVGT